MDYLLAYLPAKQQKVVVKATKLERWTAHLKINKGEEAVIKAFPRRMDGQSIKWFRAWACLSSDLFKDTE